MYAAAYLRMIIDAWEEKYPTIAENPYILITLYNIGFDKDDPHSEPKSNAFGAYAGYAYDMVENLIKN